VKNILGIIAGLIVLHYHNIGCMQNGAAAHRIRIYLNSTNAKNLERVTEELIAGARSQNQNLMLQEKLAIKRESLKKSRAEKRTQKKQIWKSVIKNKCRE